MFCNAEVILEREVNSWANPELRRGRGPPCWKQYSLCANLKSCDEMMKLPRCGCEQKNGRCAGLNASWRCAKRRVCFSAGQELPDKRGLIALDSERFIFTSTGLNVLSYQKSPTGPNTLPHDGIPVQSFLPNRE